MAALNNIASRLNPKCTTQDLDACKTPAEMDDLEAQLKAAKNQLSKVDAGIAKVVAAINADSFVPTRGR